MDTLLTNAFKNIAFKGNKQMDINNKKLPLIMFAFFPGIANADELNQENTAWILISTALVLFMTLLGLSLFYVGLVRSKSVLSVLMQCFAITCIVPII